MNFKDQYRQEMDQFSPSPESTQRLQGALQAARKPHRSSLRRLQWGLSTLAVVCVALIAVLVLWHRPTVSQSDMQVVTSSVPTLQNGGTYYKNVLALYRRLAQEQRDQEAQTRLQETTQGILSLFNPFSWGSSGGLQADSVPKTMSSEDTAGGQTASSITPEFSGTFQQRYQVP